MFRGGRGYAIYGDAQTLAQSASIVHSVFPMGSLKSLATIHSYHCWYVSSHPTGFVIKWAQGSSVLRVCP